AVRDMAGGSKRQGRTGQEDTSGSGPRTIEAARRPPRSVQTRTSGLVVTALSLSDQDAVHVDVVENGEPEVVGTGVLALLEHDVRVLDRARDRLQRRAVQVALQRRGAAPAEPLPAVADGVRRRGRRVAADVVDVAVLHLELEHRRA